MGFGHSRDTLPDKETHKAASDGYAYGTSEMCYDDRFRLQPHREDLFPPRKVLGEAAQSAGHTAEQRATTVGT